jgi:hypothetical protein
MAAVPAPSPPGTPTAAEAEPADGVGPADEDAEPDVQALRGTPTASASAAKTSRRLGRESTGRREVVTRYILPYWPDSLRHGTPSIRHAQALIRHASLPIEASRNKIRYKVDITEFFLALSVNFRQCWS